MAGYIWEVGTEWPEPTFGYVDTLVNRCRVNPPSEHILNPAPLSLTDVKIVDISSLVVKHLLLPKGAGLTIKWPANKPNPPLFFNRHKPSYVLFRSHFITCFW